MGDPDWIHGEQKIMETIINTGPANESQKRPWKTKQEIAAHFQCDERTISNWMRRRILPYVKVRGLLRFDAAECDRAFEQFKTKSRFATPETSVTVPVSGAGGAGSPPPPPPATPPPAASVLTVIPCRVFGSIADLRAFLDQVEAAPPNPTAERFTLMVLRSNPGPVSPNP